MSYSEFAFAKYLDEYFPKFISDLMSVTRINSCTVSNFPGIRQTADWCLEKFQTLGFTGVWEPMPVEIGRAGHLILTRLGNNTQNQKNQNFKKILWIGHLDTVYPETTGFTESHFDPKNPNHLVGPGVLDMKGGIVMLYYVLKILKDLNNLEFYDWTIALMGDEENTGTPIEISRKTLINLGKHHDCALGLEFGADLAHLVTKRRGSQKWQIKLQNVSGHSSKVRLSDPGSWGAILGLTEFLQNLMRVLQQDPDFADCSFNPAVIAGGTEAQYDYNTAVGNISGKANLISEQALVFGDFRYSGDPQLKKLKKIISETTQNIQALYPGVQLIHFEWVGVTHPPLTEHAQTYILFEKFKKIQKKMGFPDLKKYPVTARGAADGNYLSHDLPVIDGLGALGDHAHVAHKEYINLENTKMAMARLIGLFTLI